MLATAPALLAVSKPVTVEVDLSSAATPFGHNWQRCFGSGHALLGTRSDWRAQLQTSVDQLGLRGLRMHGWLDDDMSVISPKDGSFQFFNVDTIADYLVDVGVTPIIELSFMPSALAKCKPADCVYAFGNRGGYKGLTMPPADYEEWYRLVRALATHLLERHGIAKVSTWKFEVWNEMWGMPYPSAYLPLYNASQAALKDVHPALQIGGPSSAGLEFVADFIADTAKGGMAVDFVSTHHYPSDPSCSHAGGEHAADPDCFAKDVLASAAIAEAANKPFLLTEYKDGLQGGPGTSFGGKHGDMSYAAAFVMRNIPLLASLDVLSWWTFSDIFEEGSMYGMPFYGGYGLQTVHGVKKPVFRAFELLAGAGTRRARTTVADSAPAFKNASFYGGSTISAFATLGGPDGVGDALQVFVANFAGEKGTAPAPVAPVSRNVTIVLHAAADAPTSALLRRIDDNSTAPFAAWQAMGSPPYPTKSQIAALHAASETRDEMRPLAKDGSLMFEVPAYGVVAVSYQ